MFLFSVEFGTPKFTHLKIPVKKSHEENLNGSTLSRSWLSSLMPWDQICSPQNLGLCPKKNAEKCRGWGPWVFTGGIFLLALKDHGGWLVRMIHFVFEVVPFIIPGSSRYVKFLPFGRFFRVKRHKFYTLGRSRYNFQGIWWRFFHELRCTVKDVSHENGVAIFLCVFFMFLFSERITQENFKKVRQTTSVNCSETLWYCWWKKSCTSWYGKYPIICRDFTSQVVIAGFLNHQQYLVIPCVFSLKSRKY